MLHRGGHVGKWRGTVLWLCEKITSRAMASKETDQLIEDEPQTFQPLHKMIEQLNSGNSEVSLQNESLENEKTSKRKRANQADVQTQTPKKSKRDNPMDKILEVNGEELCTDHNAQSHIFEDFSEFLSENFSSYNEETSQPSQQPTEDIFQTAMGETVLEPSSLVVNSEANMPFTAWSFPLMGLPQIEMLQDPFSSYSEVSSLQSLITVQISADATLQLNEQLRKHVQLLTQMHLITAQQAGLENATETCRLMLQELVPLKQRVDIANLDEAIDLVNYWETVVTKEKPEELKKYQRTVVGDG